MRFSLIEILLAIVLAAVVISVPVAAIKHERRKAKAVHSVTESDSRVWVYEYEGKTYLVNRDGGIIEHRKDDNQ